MWQPIETAPKDGTRLWLFDPPDYAQVGYWRGEWLTIDVQCGGFCEASPTHWMPLPEPPQ